jgi:hypothetical protein
MVMSVLLFCICPPLWYWYLKSHIREAWEKYFSYLFIGFWTLKVCFSGSKWSGQETFRTSFKGGCWMLLNSKILLSTKLKKIPFAANCEFNIQLCDTKPFTKALMVNDDIRFFHFLTIKNLRRETVILGFHLILSFSFVIIRHLMW